MEVGEVVVVVVEVVGCVVVVLVVAGFVVGCEVGCEVVVVPSVAVGDDGVVEVFPVEVLSPEGGLVPSELVAPGSCLPVGPAGEEVVGAVDTACETAPLSLLGLPVA